jgi:protein TonB
MEIKKSPKANLEDKRFTFVLMGLVAALCILYTAFEWNQQEITVHEVGNEEMFFEEEIEIEQTFQEEPPICSAFYILQNDYVVTIVMSINDTPKEITDNFEEGY